MPKLKLSIRDKDIRETKRRFEVIEAEEEFKLTEQSQAQFVVPKTSALNYDVAYGSDIAQFFVDGELRFGGPVGFIEHGESTSTIMVNSYEQFAREAEFPPGLTTFKNVDSAGIIQQALQYVPEVNAGSLNEEGFEVNVTTSNRTPREIIRRAERLTNLQVWYTPDGKVDLGLVGKDHYAKDTISTSNFKILDKFDVKPNDPRKQFTHVWVRGIGEGDGQETWLFTPSTKEADIYSDRYGNDESIKVLASYMDDWEEGDKRRFTSFESTDIGGTNADVDEGVQVAQHFQTKTTSISFKIRESDYFSGERPRLGDRITISAPDYGINDLGVNIVEMTRRSSADGVICDIRVSLRNNLVDLDAGKVQKDTTRYNLNYEGEDATINRVSDWIPMDGSTDATWTFEVPKYKNERDTQLTLSGYDVREWDGTGDNRTINTEQCDIGPVDVIFNGTLELDGVGPDSGEFEETTDVTGKLEQGSNEINISASGTGYAEVIIDASVLTTVQLG